MRVSLFSVLCLGLGLTLPPAAQAAPLQTTKYVYYPVSGNSAADVYAAMLRSGPHVDGAKAYAATTATTSQDGNLQQGSSCQIDNYRLRIEFTIKLPKLSPGSHLAGGEMSRWQSFAAFVKRHEETHRSIWLACAQSLENQVRTIKAKNCSDASRQAAALWDRMRVSCSAKHNAFDAAQARVLLKQPFVAMVLNHRGTITNAAAVP
jgi:predicted secreted Zn-dependent protease